MRRWVFSSMVALVLMAATAAVMDVEAAQKEHRMITGAIVTMDAKAMTLVVDREVDGSRPEPIGFIVEQSATVRIHGLRGKLDQLKPGDIVTVKFSEKEGKNRASEIQHM